MASTETLSRPHEPATVGQPLEKQNLSEVATLWILSLQRMGLYEGLLREHAGVAVAAEFAGQAKLRYKTPTHDYTLNLERPQRDIQGAAEREDVSKLTSADLHIAYTKIPKGKPEDRTTDHYFFYPGKPVRKGIRASAAEATHKELAELKEIIEQSSFDLPNGVKVFHSLNVS